MKKIWLISLCFLFAGCVSSKMTETGPRQSDELFSQTNQLQEKNIQKEPQIVKIKIETSMGDIYADLYAAEAPQTVENFKKLTQKGFYDGLIFHRVIPDFMIQTGDPTGTGRGGPGYTFKDEFSPKLRHSKAGVLSMANAGPNTNGSQFFITDAPTPWLDNRHSVFGQVTQGLEVVNAIANVPRDAQDKPRTAVTMKKVTLLSE